MERIELYKALAAFQQEVPTIHEGTKGYGYTYANLNKILSIINPLLQKNGLGFTQVFEVTVLILLYFILKVERL